MVADGPVFIYAKSKIKFRFRFCLLPSAPHSHSTKSQTVEIELSAQPGETISQILTGAPGDAQQSAMCACRAGVCIAARPPGHASLSGSPRDMRALPLEESDFSTNRMTAIEVP